MPKYVYRVSYQCTVFASVEVEADTPVEAKEIARNKRSTEFEIERHTLTPETVESINIK